MRELILNTAFKHFVQLGYARTTLSGIARELGKQKGALYYYFKNKEDIFVSIVSLEAENFCLEMEKILVSKDSEIAIIKKYITQRIRTMYSVAARYNLLKEELFVLLPMIEVTRQPFHAKEVQLLASVLKRGIENGTINEGNAEVTALVIVNCLKGLEIPMFVKQEFKVDAMEIEGIISMILNGIKTTTN